MKRMHVHVSVADLDDSIRFYSALFGTAPSVRKPDYAKWMMEDPRVNFAISPHQSKQDVHHLGIQVDSHEELEALHSRQKQADGTSTTALDKVDCCYARPHKSWSTDPAGIRWEAFLTEASADVLGERPVAATPKSSAEKTCCAPSCCAA